MLGCVMVSTRPTMHSLGSKESLPCTLRRCLAVSGEGEREGSGMDREGGRRGKGVGGKGILSKIADTLIVWTPQ